MDILFSLFLVVTGIGLLAWCGDKLVSGSVSLALHFKLSRVFVGVAIMGFGTSLPELITSVSAALNGTPLLLLGNIVGSNIANVGLPLGLAMALYAGHVHMKESRHDFYLMLGVYALFAVLVFGVVHTSPMWGVVLLALLAGHVYLSLKIAQKHGIHTAATGTETAQFSHSEPETGMFSVKTAIMWVVLGLAGLVLGANLLIKGAVTLAEVMGIPERIIGLTLVAVGTSLPEIAAGIAAVRKNEPHMMVGNVLGSNVFNILAGIGVGTLLLPLNLSTVAADVLVMLAMAALIAPLFFINRIPSRLVGLVMVLCYAAYMVWVAIA